MKKLLLFGLFFTASFAFSQENVLVENSDFTEIYKGGNEQLAKDVEDQFMTFSSEFQVNGDFLLTFDLDENGKITHPKVLPEVDPAFSNELIRTFKRMKKNFQADAPKNDLKVLFSFSTNFKDTAGSSRFLNSSPRLR